MRNPCHTCERALLDKNECAQDCERRHEYCVHLGISVTGVIPPLPLDLGHTTPTRTTKIPAQKVPKPPRVPKPPKLPKLPCLNHPDWPAYDRRNRLCRNCVKERNLEKARVRQAKALAKSLKSKYDWHAPRPMRSKGGRFEQATVCIKEGRGNRETCRLAGMSKNTVAKLRAVLEQQNDGPFLCVCGKPATHQGWCSYRFAESLERRAFIRKWVSESPDATHRQSPLL